MSSKLSILDSTQLARILDDAFHLLLSPGIKIESAEASELLCSAGAIVQDGRVRIPAQLVEKSLAAVPREFSLYDRAGHPAVRYGGDAVHFDPGSSCLNVLDSETLQPRPATSADLAQLIQVAEMLPQFAAQSTAVVCCDVPSEIADLYRLLLVLWYSDKPVVTGAFTAAGLRPMLDLLAAEAGSGVRAIFDVCPTPPLTWSEFGVSNLLELARAGVPAQLVSMPLAGVAAPVTLAGAVAQHAAESLSGLVIHQLAAPGAPLVWGGAPAIVDMRSGATPMGAIETVMINLACAQAGKHFGLPTHAYLVASDSRLLDAQAGMESGISAVLGALAGINMISGAGMLDALACHSAEKLVLDAEAIASAQRLLAGVTARSDTLAMFAAAAEGGEFVGEFLKIPETRALFRQEQHLPSAVIARGDAEGDAFSRAHARVRELTSAYCRPALSPQLEAALKSAVEPHARRVGLKSWPGL